MVSCLTFGLMGELSFSSIVAHANLYPHISSVAPAGCVHSSHWPPPPFLSRGIAQTATVVVSCLMCASLMHEWRCAGLINRCSFEGHGTCDAHTYANQKHPWTNLLCSYSAAVLSPWAGFTSFSYLCVFQLLPINNPILDNLIPCRWSHLGFDRWYFPLPELHRTLLSLKCRLKAAFLRTCVLRSHAHSGALGLL